MRLDQACLRSLVTALGSLQLPPRAPELRLLHRWLDTWTGVGLIVVEGEWRAVFMSNPMFAPNGFGVGADAVDGGAAGGVGGVGRGGPLSSTRCSLPPISLATIDAPGQC